MTAEVKACVYFVNRHPDTHASTHTPSHPSCHRAALANQMAVWQPSTRPENTTACAGVLNVRLRWGTVVTTAGVRVVQSSHLTPTCHVWASLLFPSVHIVLERSRVISRRFGYSELAWLLLVDSTLCFHHLLLPLFFAAHQASLCPPNAPLYLP